MYKIIKRNSIKNILSNIYGGKWRYDSMATWICDDNKRTVSRVKSCDCDSDCYCPNYYYLYGDGIPVKVNLY